MENLNLVEHNLFFKINLWASFSNWSFFFFNKTINIYGKASWFLQDLHVIWLYPEGNFVNKQKYSFDKSIQYLSIHSISVLDTSVVDLVFRWLKGTTQIWITKRSWSCGEQAVCFWLDMFSNPIETVLRIPKTHSRCYLSFPSIYFELYTYKNHINAAHS